MQCAYLHADHDKQELRRCPLALGHTGAHPKTGDALEAAILYVAHGTAFDVRHEARIIERH